VRTYLLSLTPVSRGGSGWRYELQDDVRITQVHSGRASTFAQRIGDDPDAALDGLLLNLPEPVLVEHPELCTQVLRALAPALRAAQRNYTLLHADPRGRELLRDLLSRATVISRVQWDGTLVPAVLVKVVAALPAK
jgi:hypothetical protein